MIRLTLPYPPSVNHYWRSVQIRGRGNVMLISQEGRKYKEAVRRYCVGNRVQPLDGDVAVTFTVYRPRKSGDLDNTQKSLFDSLAGFAWHDDKQIIEIHAYRADDKNNPRAEVEVVGLSKQQEIEYK